jgi:flagellar biosynthesis protein FlhG
MKQESKVQHEGWIRMGMGEKGTAERRQTVCRVVSFTSGKGGVGKTHTAVNVALSLAERGKSVLLLDADLGLANVDVLLDLKPQANLHDVLKGNASLDDVILKGPGGVSLIPAASGVSTLGALTTDERLGLFSEIERVAFQYDYLLIDTGAGIGADVLSFNGASSEIVCVVTPEPTSLTDSYALMKVLSTSLGERRFSVVVNCAGTEAEARKTFRSLSESVQRFLGVSVSYLGFIPRDQAVSECIMMRRPVVLERPSNRVSRSIDGIAAKLEDSFGAPRVKGGMQLFFQQILAVEEYGSEALR